MPCLVFQLTRQFHWRIISALIASAAVIVPSRAEESKTLEHVPIFGTDLIKDSLIFDPSWKSGVLRVAISGITGASWKIRLNYGAAGVLNLDEKSIKPRVVRSVQGALFVDLPVAAGEAISASSTLGGVKIIAVEAIVSSGLHSEQMIPDSNVVSISPAKSQHKPSRESSFARADLLGSNGEFIGICTAFRVAKTYWMSAAHCAYRDAKHSNGATVSRFRIQPNSYADTVEDSPPFLAAPIASGLRAPLVSPESIMADDDLDYVLLQGPDDPGSVSLSIQAGVGANVGTSLSLLQYWRGEIPPSAGKAIAEGESCKILSHIGPNDPSRADLCPGVIQHGCSSQEGASGGPLVARMTSELIAIHYGAGLTSKFNCGVPIPLVAKDLCGRFPSIAGKVISC